MKQPLTRICSRQMMLPTHHLHLRYSHCSSTQHCLQFLKQHDPESVLQLPFWPAEAQSAFVAIRSFHSELLLIPSSVSSGKTVIAQIRYQWWRDAIESCYTSCSHLSSHHEQPIHQQQHPVPSNHPLMQILITTIQKHGLSKYYFTRTINALENHYLQPRFASTKEMVQFSQSTTYSNLSLLFQVLNSVTTRNASHLPLQTIDHALSHLSNFLTIVKLLKQIPNYLNKLQINFIPVDLMQCSDEDLFRLFRSPSNHYQQALSPPLLPTSKSERIQSVHSTLLNLLDLASSELIATREVLSPNHSHHHSEDLKHSPPSQPPKEINGHHLDLQHKISIPEPGLMPLFLTAVSAKNHIKKLETLFNQLVHLKTQDHHNKHQLNMILNQFLSISSKSDWKLPFQIGYDFFFKKL